MSHSRTTSRVLAVALTLLLSISPTGVHTQTASVNRLLLTLQQQDLAGSPILNRQIGFVTYNGTVGALQVNILPTTGETTIALPTPTILQLYLRNTHATATITVKWTPQGGAEATIHIVRPGGVLVFWQPSTSATTGITGLKLTASVANTTYELFLGG